MKPPVPDTAKVGTASSGAVGADAHAASVRNPVWRRFALLFLGVFVTVVGIAYAFIILVDPYDTGRFVSFGLRSPYDGTTSGLADVTGGIPASGAASSEASFGDTDTSQRTSNVALGRLPRFNAAIFGNSHGQLLSPQRLSRATGLAFVQLTVPGSNVREQLAMMHWFIAHHTDIGAMVLALDERWCVTDPALPLRTPFPFWLYSDSNLVYLASAMSTRSLRDSIRRVAAAFGSRPTVDPAGYADYEMGKTWSFKPGSPATADDFPVGDGRSSRDFPGLIRLDAALGEIPATTPVVIVMPPQFYTRLPPAGTAAAQFRDACKDRMAQRARRGAGSAFIDFLVDSEIARAPENFMDDEHYRANIARIIEADIAGALGMRREATGRD
jgi:hypothetical protein